MARFLAARILGGVLTLWAIATLCFFIVRFAPGNPFSGERTLSATAQQNLERKYGLDKPVHVQYFLRMKGYLTGDFGLSVKYEGRQVDEMIFPSLGTSIQLGSLAFLLAMILGMTVGLTASAFHNRYPDYLSMSFALMGICVPNFLLGPLLALVFGLALGWLPVAGWPQSFAPGELVKLILPSATLAMVHVAYVSRLMRAGMLDVLHRDFIRTARAKGVGEWAVVMKHGLKNGATPVLSYAGPMAAFVFTGSVVVEKIFNIPGMGQHFVDSALVRDMPVVMGTLLIYSTLIIAFNMVVDIGYSILDPRVRLG